MIDHQKRVQDLIKDHLKPRAMGVPYGFSISPVIAPMPGPPGPDGQPTASGQLGPAWDFRLTVQGVPLLGQDNGDIIAYMIIPGVMPPDNVFQMFAEKALDDCLNERSARMNVERVPGNDSV
jgi:hypothetical protein